MAQADALQQQKQPEQAIALYQHWLLGQTDPLRLVAWFNLGVLLASAGRTSEAQAAYQEALQLNPQFLQARLNLGHQLESQGAVAEAIAQWQLVLQSLEQTAQPEQALQLHALNNLGRILESERRFEEAAQYLAQSLEIDPEQSAPLQHYIHIRQKQCAWPIYQPLGVIGVNQQLLSTSALAALALHDDPAVQLLAAREFVHAKVRATVPRRSARQRAPSERIRIGYLSGDLCMHAVGLLTVELFELHDREKFEVFGFCWSREDGSPLRERIIRAFDHHIRIGHLDDEAAAQLIAACGIDILVDLQGLTSGARPNILAQRPASVQVSYLGLPATCGMPAIDYILADPFVFPPELEPFMTEKPLRVPHCYQVSDRQRSVGPALSRADCGLPEDKVVFASFNNNYKFTQEVVATWMRILQRVPESVLWLLADNNWAEQNIRKEAQRHGIEVERLIFSGRAMPQEYMARLQLPDLFLDTHPYNAGTTANDILWMGTPILTYSGRSYISRMCGSLLTAAGLPDLITYSLAEYEEKAVQLGSNPRRLASYRRYLQEYRLESNLFNIPKLVEDIEKSFILIAN
ncbi:MULTISPECIES: O-linked N-acetylglucosamine transferase, SPINDLY family protein [Giesbergeria]|uniref:protein O-GlcNAc transferase n=1 Tax=Giesbergeria sinuosa TaxID=80883 RepID=A0ABV9Q7E2_9BURK